MTKDEALKLALEALEMFCEHGAILRPIETRDAIKEALAQPEQEINKDGSPCPEFWDWLPKAYNFEGNGNFSKYNMEVAFLAGKQAPQRTWMGLTLDDIPDDDTNNLDFYRGGRWAERVLKGKNT